MTEQDRKGPLPPDLEETRLKEGEEPAPRGVFMMAIVRWCLVLAMAVVAGASLWHVFGNSEHQHGSAGDRQYYCPMHPSVVQDQPGTCPICSMTLVPRDAPGSTSDSPPTASNARADPDHAGHRHEQSDPYVCPMHPEETGIDADATCPLCGMRLELKPAATTSTNTAAREGTPSSPSAVPKGLTPVNLAAERIQLIGMRTARAVRGKLPSDVHAFGLIAAPESGIASVQTLFSGWIEELHVAETGQPVTRGQLLARIYSPDLLAAQEELLNAKRWSDPTAPHASPTSPNSLAEDARRRLLLMGMRAAEIAEVERSGKPHRLVEVRSPTRGYVAQKAAVEGLYVQPGTQLFQIADLARVWVLVEVFERDAGRVHAGQPATLTATAYAGETFSGTVKLVYPTLDPATRTLRARVELNNPELKLKPGMFAEVTLQGTAPEALLIPREALVDTGEQQYVFVEEREGRFEPRLVQVGARAHNVVEIRAGLVEGEQVVETGNFLIDSESRLRAAIEGSEISSPAMKSTSTCDELFDRARFQGKYDTCRACERQHRGMGSMEDDCRNAIPKPWR